jgi:hypothetical protein
MQEVVLGVRAGAGETQGVLGHVHTLGNRMRRSVADGGVRVPEVLTDVEWRKRKMNGSRCLSIVSGAVASIEMPMPPFGNRAAKH